MLEEPLKPHLIPIMKVDFVRESSRVTLHTRIPRPASGTDRSGQVWRAAEAPSRR